MNEDLNQQYDADGQLEISIDKISKLKLQTKSIDPKSPDRKDKSVTVIDKDGNTKVSSSILMGKNGEHIQLKDGTFLNADDLVTAIEKSLKEKEEGTIIVNSKGEPFDINKLITIARKAAGLIHVGTKNEKITNQDTRNWSVESTDGRKFKKGVAFLCNDGIKLPSGTYVNQTEILKALQEYMIMVPKKEKAPVPPKIPSSPSIPFTPQPEKKQKNIIRVVRKYTNRASKWLAAIASITVLLSGFKIEDQIHQYRVPVQVRNVITEIVPAETLKIDFGGIDYVVDTPDGTIRRLVDELSMGDELEVKNGQSFYSNSIETGISKKIGKEFNLENKFAGFYRVTGFSIIYNGQMLAPIEDFNAQDNTTKLGDIIDKTLAKNNLSYDDITIMVHLGTNKDNSRLGWININELINENTITHDMLQLKAKKASTESITVDNFQGNTITLENGTQLKVLDEKGNLLPNGTHVFGTDGKEYVIEGIEIEGTTKEVKKIETETVFQDRTKVTGKKLTWNIQNCDLAQGILPVLMAVAFEIKNRKKNKKTQENPFLHEFKDDEQYQTFKKEFEQAKENYEKKSKFGKIFKRIFYKKEVDTLQKLNNIQTTDLYRIIMKYNGDKFTISSADQLKIEHGKILIQHPNGNIMDITQIVMEDIASIGQGNDIVAEGRLEGRRTR